MAVQPALPSGGRRGRFVSFAFSGMTAI